MTLPTPELFSGLKNSDRPLIRKGRGVLLRKRRRDAGLRAAG